MMQYFEISIISLLYVFEEAPQPDSDQRKKLKHKVSSEVWSKPLPIPPKNINS